MSVSKPKLVEMGIYELPNGRYKGTIATKDGNKTKTVDTLEEAREFRASFKTKRQYKRRAIPTIASTEVNSFKEIKFPNSESFVLIIARDASVIDNIISKFL